MPDLDDKYSEFSREIGNDEPTQDNAAGAEKEPQPDFSDNADLYAVLCVSKTASTDEIKSAYRRLAKEYHPDVSSDADADEKFKKKFSMPMKSCSMKCSVRCMILAATAWRG